MPSKEYLEEVWAIAKKTLPGWAFAAIHTQARAAAGGRNSRKGTAAEFNASVADMSDDDVRTMAKALMADVTRRGLKIEADEAHKSEPAPEPVEKKETGRKPDGKPGDWTIQSLIFPKDKFTLAEAEKWTEEHEGFSNNGSDETETSYRFRQYDPEHFKSFRNKEMPSSGGIIAVYGQIKKSDEKPKEDEEKMEKQFVQIAKANASKRIVYGVVMDPYGPDGAKPDAHKDYIPPATIEDTAHKFILGDRTIGMQHMAKANAQLVESSIEQYPTHEDYVKAMAGEPHNVYRRPFGDDVVHSGSWIVGVRLGDAEWEAYEKREINAFSPGGTAVRNPIEKKDMPAVNFILLAEGK